MTKETLGAANLVGRRQVEGYEPEPHQRVEKSERPFAVGARSERVRQHASQVRRADHEARHGSLGHALAR